MYIISERSLIYGGGGAIGSYTISMEIKRQLYGPVMQFIIGDHYVVDVIW